jgi:adenylate cyclase
MPKGVKEPISIYEVGGIAGDYNIFLPDKTKSELKELPKPLTVKFTIMEGKHISEQAHPGNIIRLADKVAEITASRGCRKLTNLKISLFDDDGSTITSDLYAKVIETISESPPTFRVNFTSVPPKAESFLEKVSVS